VTTPRSHPLAVVAVVILTAAAAHAGPTLVTINLDGRFDDWAPVLNNPLQYSRDANGTVCPPGDDLDCQVGTPGRDILAFSWTYDPTYVYVYLERFGSPTNTMNFFFMMDLDATLTDGVAFLGDTDKVFRVKFFGSNGVTEADLCNYVPSGTAQCGGAACLCSGSACDPANCPSAGGCTNSTGRVAPYLSVDGYDARGSVGTCVSAGAQSGGDKTAGPLQGLRFEARVRWTDIGVPAGSPILWHVASQNNSDWAGNADDNAGAPNGKLGSFAFVDFTFAPDRQSGVEPPRRARYAHRLTVSGAEPSAFNFQALSSLGLEVAFFEDTDGGDPATGLRPLAVDGNGDGDFTDGVDELPDGVDDENLDGIPDTGISLLSSGDTFDLVVEIVTSTIYSNITDVTTITATANADERITRKVVDQTAIGLFTIGPSHIKRGVAGDVVNLQHFVRNNSASADRVNLSATSERGWTLALLEDCSGTGDPTGCTPLTDTNGDSEPDTGSLAAGGESTFIAQLSIPAGTALGTVDLVTILGDVVLAGFSPSVRDRITVTPALTVVPTGHAVRTTPVSRVLLPHRITNARSTAETLSFSSTRSGGSTCSAAPSTVNVWTDPDGDGSIQDGVLLWDGTVDVNTSAIVPNGGEIHVVVEVVVPGAQLSCGEVHNVRATSIAAATSFVDMVEAVTVGRVATFRDALRSQAATVFSRCDTIYTRIGGLAADLAQGYRLTYDDAALPAERNVLLDTDTRGEGFDELTLDAAAALGPWTLDLDLAAGTQLETATINVEVSGSATGLEILSPQSYLEQITISADIAFSLFLGNANDFVSWRGTTLRYAITNSDRTRYYGSSGWAAFSGDLSTQLTGQIDGIDVAVQASELILGVANDVPLDTSGSGLYQIVLGWFLECGAPIDETSTSFFMGDCSDDLDADGCNRCLDDDDDVFTPDADDDGFGSGCDCDDGDRNVYPGGYEVCGDAVDNNCDSSVDDDDPQCPNLCADSDHDGFAAEACFGTDCNDSHPFVHPLAGEHCFDAADNNCNGLIDASDPLCPDGCADDDGDGYKDVECGGSDCDDDTLSVNPGAGESCIDGVDNDCDGQIDEGDLVNCPVGCTDDDNDGYRAATCGGSDCDDAARLIHPGAGERCDDGEDNNCDLLVDTADPFCPLGCADADEDGYRDSECGGADCDDDNAQVNTSRAERCDDTLDNDCDTFIDAADATDCPADCADADSDGFASAGCGGWDCDDQSFAVHPLAGEECRDGRDNNCDGRIDGDDALCPEGCDDDDRDGYPSDGCGGSDCNDDAFSVHPGAGEHCTDSVDNDCNGLADGADVGGCPAGCIDSDGDGYVAWSCGGTDCGDSQTEVHPGLADTCDELDNDCDAQLDEGYFEPDGEQRWVECPGDTSLAGGGCACSSNEAPGALGLLGFLALLRLVGARRPSRRLASAISH
jgi:hypothetical protein